MSKKILVWIDYSFLFFGISKFLSKKDYEIFGMIDSEESVNKFFQTQKIVNFSKLWYLYDHVSMSTPDIEYLKKIEQKYNLNIWSVAYSDRYFYKKFNRYHTFNRDEILSILEQECKIFEKILEEIKPDFVLSNSITHHYQYLFYKMCKSLEIPVLTLEPMRFANRWIVTNGLIYDLDETFLKQINQDNVPSLNKIDELHTATGKIQASKPKNLIKNSKFYKIKALLNFFLFSNNITKSKRISSYGRTRKNVLLKGNARIFLLKKKLRKKFIDKFLLNSIPYSSSFIYFPLHYDPEKVLLIGAPFFDDQISVITNIAKSLPVGIDLFVKEHPNMRHEGWRDNSFYKKIMELPNVKLVHPSLSSDELLEKCKMAISISGTTSIEAIMHDKPSIVIKPDIWHNIIPSIKSLTNIEELPMAIRETLNAKVSKSEMDYFWNFINTKSFEFDMVDYSNKVSERLNYSIGYLHEIKIQNSEIKKLLDDLKIPYENLAKQFDLLMKNSKIFGSESDSINNDSKN